MNDPEKTIALQRDLLLFRAAVIERYEVMLREAHKRVLELEQIIEVNRLVSSGACERAAQA